MGEAGEPSPGREDVNEKLSFLRRSWRGFLAGFAVTLISAVIATNWDILANPFVEGEYFVSDRQPVWLKGIQAFVDYLPWFVGAALIVARLLKRSTLSIPGYAIGAVTPYVALLAYVFLAPSIENRMRSRSFESAGWLANDDTSSVMWPTRLRMIDDLMAEHSPVGLSRDSVIRMLGPSDSTPYFQDWDMVYQLGPERGFLSFDSEWLVLRVRNDTVA